MPFPSSGDLPHAGIKPRSPLFHVLVDEFFTIEPPGTLIKMKINFKPNTWTKLFNKGLTRGPMVKNPPSNAKDTGSIPGQGMEIPHA